MYSAPVFLGMQDLLSQKSPGHWWKNSTQFYRIFLITMLFNSIAWQQVKYYLYLMRWIKNAIGFINLIFFLDVCPRSLFSTFLCSVAPACLDRSDLFRLSFGDKLSKRTTYMESMGTCSGVEEGFLAEHSSASSAHWLAPCAWTVASSHFPGDALTHSLYISATRRQNV